MTRRTLTTLQATKKKTSTHKLRSSQFYRLEKGIPQDRLRHPTSSNHTQAVKSIALLLKSKQSSSFVGERTNKVEKQLKVGTNTFQGYHVRVLQVQGLSQTEERGMKGRKRDRRKGETAVNG